MTKGDRPLKSPSIQTSADDGSVSTCRPLLLPGGFWDGSCGGLPEDFEAEAPCAATTFPSVAPLLVAHEATRSMHAAHSAVTRRRRAHRAPRPRFTMAPL